MTAKKTQPRIFLIRHGRPLVSRAGFFDYNKAAQFIKDYDAAGVEEFDRILGDVDFTKLKLVHCSTLERSRDTARKLFGEQMPLAENAVFREFERRMLWLPLLKMPVKWWLVLSRALWLLGFNRNGIETFADARKRAKSGAQILAEEAKKEGVAVLVAHGFLNRFIVRALQQKGWRLNKVANYGFAGATELVLQTK